MYYNSKVLIIFYVGITYPQVYYQMLRINPPLLIFAFSFAVVISKTSPEEFISVYPIILLFYLYALKCFYIYSLLFTPLFKFTLKNFIMCPNFICHVFTFLSHKLNTIFRVCIFTNIYALLISK